MRCLIFLSLLNYGSAFPKLYREIFVRYLFTVNSSSDVERTKCLWRRCSWYFVSLVFSDHLSRFDILILSPYTLCFPAISILFVMHVTSLYKWDRNRWESHGNSCSAGNREIFIYQNHRYHRILVYSLIAVTTLVSRIIFYIACEFFRTKTPHI